MPSSENKIKTAAEKAMEKAETGKKEKVKDKNEMSKEQMEESLKKARDASDKSLKSIDLRIQEGIMERAKEQGKGTVGSSTSFNLWMEGSQKHDLYKEIHQGFRESSFGGQDTWKGVLADTVSLGITNTIRRYKFNKQYNERISAIQNERRELEEKERRSEEREREEGFKQIKERFKE